MSPRLTRVAASPVCISAGNAVVHMLLLDSFTVSYTNQHVIRAHFVSPIFRYVKQRLFCKFAKRYTRRALNDLFRSAFWGQQQFTDNVGRSQAAPNEQCPRRSHKSCLTDSSVNHSSVQEKRNTKTNPGKRQAVPDAYGGCWSRGPCCLAIDRLAVTLSL